MAKYLGATKLALPSAGNAGGALAAYTLTDGLITDCGAEIAGRKNKEGWFDLSTLKEPYRESAGNQADENLDSERRPISPALQGR